MSMSAIQRSSPIVVDISDDEAMGSRRPCRRAPGGPRSPVPLGVKILSAASRSKSRRSFERPSPARDRCASARWGELGVAAPPQDVQVAPPIDDDDLDVDGVCGDAQPGPKARCAKHRDRGRSRPDPAQRLSTSLGLPAPARAHARPRDPRVTARSCPDFVAIGGCLETNPRIRARRAP